MKEIDWLLLPECRHVCFRPKAEILTCASLPDGCLTDKDEFSEEAKKEAGNIIRACVLVPCDHDYHPAEIKDILTELGTNYGCWLEIIERVLDEGPQKLSNEYDIKFT